MFKTIFLDKLVIISNILYKLLIELRVSEKYIYSSIYKTYSFLLVFKSFLTIKLPIKSYWNNLLLSGTKDFLLMWDTIKTFCPTSNLSHTLSVSFSFVAL